MKDTLAHIIIGALAELGITAETVTLEHPAEITHGDYSTNVALAYAKQAGMNPRALAEKIVATISSNMPEQIASVEIAGPGFINFKLSNAFFASATRDILSATTAFGKGAQFAQQTWAIEYASPNPNKAMHLGHLRNVLVGVSLCRIVEANGAKVIREMVDNNRGIAIAKLMWGYLVAARKDGTRVPDITYWAAHKDEWQTPADLGVRSDRFVDELYVKGATEAENPENEKEIRDLVVRWEAKDAVVWELWKHVLGYAYAGQKQTLARLGATFDFVWHEHEHYQSGKDFVEEGLAKGVFKKLDDGAILSNLEGMGLTDTVVVKKDGTALYITQDLALTDLKKKKHNADKMLWIIGPEQALAMAQLFAICEQLGVGKRSEFMHVAYGYMSIKGEGKMSSRKGNVIYLDDVIDEAKENITTLMHERVPADALDATAEQIAHAAIAFGILKAGRLTDMAFDLSEALRLEGDTGPYLQYSAVRAGSLVAKAAVSGISAIAKQPVGWQTTDLERHLYRFPEIVARAGADLAPSAIATYLIELAALFNSFYGQGLIIDKNDIPTSAYKVALTSAFRTVMENGLRLLGISVPEKM
jgi:arginyl-tRNA synthetase